MPFAIDTNQTYGHLDECVRTFVDQERDVRVREIQRQRFIETERSEMIWRRVRDLMLMPNGRAANATLLLYAESGTGKTELLRYIEDRLLEEINDASRSGKSARFRPPLKFELEKCSSDPILISRLSGGVLRGRLFSDKECPGQLERLIETWNRADAGALFIDEFSDIGKGTSGQQEAICQSMRMISNHYMRPFVASSNLLAEMILSADPNLASRFQKVPLDPWTNDLNLRDFLFQLFTFLPLKYPPYFPDDEMELFLGNLVQRTGGGITRTIVAHTSLAAIIAIDSGEERMCAGVYDKAAKYLC